MCEKATWLLSAGGQYAAMSSFRNPTMHPSACISRSSDEDPAQDMAITLSYVKVRGCQNAFEECNVKNTLTIFAIGRSCERLQCCEGFKRSISAAS